MVGPEGEQLNIGDIIIPKRGERPGERIRFTNVAGVPFDDRCPPPREVKASMKLLYHLQLVNHRDTNLTTDSLMRHISESGHVTKPTRSQCTNATRSFIKLFLNMLCYNLTFNEFIPRTKLGKASLLELTNNATPLLQHNHRILLHYFKQLDEVRYNFLFPPGIKAPEGEFHLGDILKTRGEVFNKLSAGVCTSFVASRPAVKSRSPLWIHHALLMQYVDPVINERMQQGMLTLADDDGGNVEDFLGVIRVIRRQEYGSCSGNYMTVVAWRGKEVAAFERERE